MNYLNHFTFIHYTFYINLKVFPGHISGMTKPSFVNSQSQKHSIKKKMETIHEFHELH